MEKLEQKGYGERPLPMSKRGDTVASAPITASMGCFRVAENAAALALPSPALVFAGEFRLMEAEFEAELAVVAKDHLYARGLVMISIRTGEKTWNVYHAATEANPEKEFIGFTSLEALHNSKSPVTLLSSYRRPEFTLNFSNSLCFAVIAYSP